MHFQSSKSNSSVAISSGAFEPNDPAEVDARIFGSVQNLLKPFPAVYPTNPPPRHMTRARHLEPRNFHLTGTGPRIPLVSRFSAMMDEEEMGRDLHQARDNFTTIFQSSPAILCILRLNGLQYLEINKAYEDHTGYSRNEVLGRASLRLGHWRHAEAQANDLQNSNQGWSAGPPGNLSDEDGRSSHHIFIGRDHRVWR
jgi:PAS domain-containing protein